MPIFCVFFLILLISWPVIPFAKDSQGKQVFLPQPRRRVIVNEV